MLSVHLAATVQRQRIAVGESCNPILEIGVWKGGWSSVILMNLPEIEVVGVDPYPFHPEAREFMSTSFIDLGLDDRFTLAESLDELAPDLSFAMIHVDGEHSEAAVRSDLDFAIRHLDEDGVVIVDDYRNIWYPGIAATLYQFLGTGALQMFAVSADKAYLARPSHAGSYFHELQKTFAGSSAVPVWTNRGQTDPLTPGVRDHEFLDRPVLFCGVNPPNADKGRRWITDFLPPAVTRLIRKALWRLSER